MKILRVKLIFYEGQYSQIFVQNSPFESTLPHFISNYFAPKKKKGNLLIRGKNTYLKNLQYYINYKPANPSSKSALITNSWFSTCARSIVVSIISWNLAKSINTSWNIKINIWKPLKYLELEANLVTPTLFWFKQVLSFWANTFDSYSHS